MNEYSVESFLDYCDNMMIVEEGNTSASSDFDMSKITPAIMKDYKFANVPQSARIKEYNLYITYDKKNKNTMYAIYAYKDQDGRHKLPDTKPSDLVLHLIHSERNKLKDKFTRMIWTVDTNMNVHVKLGYDD